MGRSGVVLVTVICAVLVGVGGGLLWFAPDIQRAGLHLIGKPRNRLAAWSRELAASRTGLRSIEATGALCIAFAAVLMWLLVTT